MRCWTRSTPSSSSTRAGEAARESPDPILGPPADYRFYQFHQWERPGNPVRTGVPGLFLVNCQGIRLSPKGVLEPAVESGRRAVVLDRFRHLVRGHLHLVRRGAHRDPET